MPPAEGENGVAEPEAAVPEAAAAADAASSEDKAASAAAADEGAPVEGAGEQEKQVPVPDAGGEGGTEGQNGAAESSEKAKADACEEPSEAPEAGPAEEGAPAAPSAPEGEGAPAANADADAPSGESPAPGDASAPDAAAKKKRSPRKPKTPIKYPARYPPGTLVKKSFFDDKIDKRRLFKGTVKKYDESSRLYKVVYEDGDYEELRKKEVDKILDVRCLDYLGAKFIGGTKVAKLFPDPEKDGKEKLFRGKVTGYNAKAKLYKVTYDDGDAEELTEAEVTGALVDKGNKYPLYAKVMKEFHDKKLKAKRPFEGRVEEYDMKAKYYIVTYEDGDSEELTEKEVEEIVVKKEDGKVEKLPKSWKPKVKPPKKHHKFGYDSDDSDFEAGGARSRKKPKVDAAPATPAKSPGGRLAALSPSGRSPRSSRKIVKYADEPDEKIERDRPQDFVAEKKKRRRTPTKSKRSPKKSPAKKRTPTKAKSPAKKKTTSAKAKSPARKKTTSAKAKSPAKKSPAKKPAAAAKRKTVRV